MEELNSIVDGEHSNLIILKSSQLLELGDRIVDRILNEVIPVAKENAVEQLLTKQEVMEKFGVCHTTLYNWEKNHVLVPVKVGRKIHYRLADVQALCAKRGIR